MELKDILTLIEKLDESSLTEIKIKEGESIVSLKKGSDVTYMTAPQLGMAPHMAMGAAPGAAPVIPSADQVQEANSGSSGTNGLEVITAPIVGSFYRSPAPDAPVFMEEGDSVDAGSTLCIIEAMKVMNQLEADFDMEIVNILVENGEMVEYGTPLFEVRRI